MSLYPGDSLDDWSTENAKKPVTIAQGILTVLDENGWVRTKWKPTRGFTLRLAARVRDVKTRAVMAILGDLETAEYPGGSAYALLLFGGVVPGLKITRC
jgi:hypothetical protein